MVQDVKTKEIAGKDAEAKSILTSMSTTFDKVNVALDNYAKMLLQELQKAKKTS